MFDLTNTTSINLSMVSSVTTQVDKDDQGDYRSDTRKYKLTPYVTVTMSNGTSYNASGLKDIYNFLLEMRCSRIWNSLVDKLLKDLAINEYNKSYFLTEEDMSYLTKLELSDSIYLK